MRRCVVVVPALAFALGCGAEAAEPPGPSGAPGNGGASGAPGGPTAGSGAGATGPATGTGGHDPGSEPATGGAPTGGQPTAVGPSPYDLGVTFDWPDTVPGAGASCRAGRYVGTFDGGYSTGSLPIPVAGDINMVLVESQDGEFFEVSDGELSGMANFIIPFSARIEGRLDCTTLRFDAMLLDGMYDAFGSQGNFEGPISADYAPSTPALVNGVWTVSDPSDPSRGGNGTWQASWVP
jgi:hypothetical protein